MCLHQSNSVFFLKHLQGNSYVASMITNFMIHGLKYTVVWTIRDILYQYNTAYFSSNLKHIVISATTTCV